MSTFIWTDYIYTFEASKISKELNFFLSKNHFYIYNSKHA